MSVMSDMMRINSKRDDAKRDAGLTIPDDVARFENIAYGAHEMQVLDVYRPRCAEQKLPVIVSVHGGGWVYGDKELYKHYCMSLAQRGFVVVNFTYRLSPESKFPCHLEDTVLVFHWLMENGYNYGMDEENIFAVGDSAGGHILSLFCALCTNPDYAAKFAFKAPEGFVPKAIALNCAVLDMDEAVAGMAGTTMQLLEDVLPEKGTDEELRLVNPVLYVNEKFPPCCITTANEDFLKTQPDRFRKKLESCGVPYEFTLYGDENNPLGHVFHLDMRNETGRQCNETQCEYFKMFLE